MFSPNTLILCSRVIPFISSTFCSEHIIHCEFCLWFCWRVWMQRNCFLLLFLFFFNGYNYVPSISWRSVSQCGISGILIHLLCHSVTLGPMCLIFCQYTLDINVFPRSQNKHFGLIFHNPSSRVYHVSSSEMLACLCFFPLLVLVFF